MLCYASLWAHRGTALQEISPSSFYWFLSFITHGPGWVKCSSLGFSSIDVYFCHRSLNPWFYLSVSCLLSQTGSLIVADCLLINLFPHCLAWWLEHRWFPMDVCGMNAWIIEWKEMKSGSFIPLQSLCNLLVFLFPFSLYLTSPFSSLLFLFFALHSQLSFLTLYNVFPVPQKPLISLPLHKKMERAGDWSINVRAGQGNHSRNRVFYWEPSAGPLSKAGVLQSPQNDRSVSELLVDSYLQFLVDEGGEDTNIVCTYIWQLGEGDMDLRIAEWHLLLVVTTAVMRGTSIAYADCPS